MKRFFAVIATMLCAVIALTAGFGCASGETDGTKQPETIRISVPDGAPALALAKLIAAGEINGNPVEVEIVSGTEVLARLTNGEADLAIAPTNGGATLYGKGIKIQMVSANTYGLLYLIGKEGESVTELSDLVGKTVHVIGEANTPDLVFRYVLDAAEIPYTTEEPFDAEKVNIRYVAEGATIVQGFAMGSEDYQFGVLGEPAASKAISNQSAKTKVTEYFDLQQEFKAARGVETTGYPQASLFAQQSWLSGHAEELEAILDLLETNTTFLKEKTEEALAAYQSAGGSDIASLTPAIVDRMNLTLVRAQDAKADVAAYLATFGIAAPADGFYYGAQA